MANLEAQGRWDLVFAFAIIAELRRQLQEMDGSLACRLAELLHAEERAKKAEVKVQDKDLAYDSLLRSYNEAKARLEDMGDDPTA